jgi:calcineurin-like phosphoesterase family protein
MSRRRIGLAIVGALALLATQALAPPLGAADAPCQVDNVERIVAVGDVHGAYDRLVDILRAAGILDARLRWAGGRTHVVQLGDVVDRGPDSRKALDLMERLQDDARRAGGAVHLLLGNHEVMRMLGDTRYVSPGEYEAFVTSKSARVREDFLQSVISTPGTPVGNTPLGFVELRLAFGRNGDYGTWLRKLNAVVKINGILFLHGGISAAVAGMSCDVINATVRRELTTDLDKTRAAPLQSLSAREDGPLWYRGLAQEPDSFASSVDDILTKQNAHAIVIGHTVVPDGRMRARFGGKVVQIDTGMQPAYIPTGRASALEIQHGVFTAIYEDRRDVLSGSPAETAVAAPVPQ